MIDVFREVLVFFRDLLDFKLNVGGISFIFSRSCKDWNVILFYKNLICSFFKF